MKPLASLVALLMIIGVILWTTIIGLIGSIYGEPLGFLFLALGITAGLWFYIGTKQFLETK